MILVLFITALIVVASLGAYYRFIHLPEQERGQLEQRIKPLMDAGLTREKALEFDEAHKGWAINNQYNTTVIDFASYLKKFPLTTHALFELAKSLSLVVGSLREAEPVISGFATGDQKTSDFVLKHPSLILDDGINATDAKLIKYYVHLPGIVDKVIEKIKSQEDRLFALEELTPYISKPLTEEQAYQLIEKWYPELFKTCKERGMPVVFGDIDEDGKNHYDEIFVHGTDPFKDDWPPLIKDLKWEPSKIVNSKVYDGIVYFVAEDPKLSEAYLIFAPKNYTHLPKEAFPEEASKRFALKPVDGAFDEKIEEFLANITDIKGGREYDIEITVKDEAGNVATASLTTPYIRQFESIAPLDDVIVAASYYFFFETWYFPTNREPFLGRYSLDDPIVMSRHIDWATGYGIDMFFISWDYDDLIPRVLKLVNNPLAKEMKFAILYDSAKRLISQDWAADFDKHYNENVKKLKEDFKYFSENFFPLKQFHIIDNKPMVYFYDSCVYIGNVSGAIASLRKYVKENFNFELYLISDHMDARQGSPADSSWTKKISPFDGITAWGGSFYGPTGVVLGDSYEEQLEILYSSWYSWSINNDKGIVPSMKPSEDTTKVPWGGPNNYILPRSPKLFSVRINTLLKYIDPKLRMIRIDTWNDWNENTEIEPSKEEKLTYLELLKDTILHTSHYRP